MERHARPAGVLKVIAYFHKTVEGIRMLDNKKVTTRRDIMIKWKGSDGRKSATRRDERAAPALCLLQDLVEARTPFARTHTYQARTPSQMAPLLASNVYHTSVPVYNEAAVSLLVGLGALSVGYSTL
ncbi:hypothetical protein EVAR_39770_1 [Eumeta japonica]|uniref:Uncharacterized protein n=1 Tax=Eumeta variegata TaxID=151549 RepID=A0A4C1X6S7_EUMVA|nr:hypothetical protein EVAR_39770_1 [Eumeta japonica]